MTNVEHDYVEVLSTRSSSVIPHVTMFCSSMNIDAQFTLRLTRLSSPELMDELLVSLSGHQLHRCLPSALTFVYGCACTP